MKNHTANPRRLVILLIVITASLSLLSTTSFSSRLIGIARALSSPARVAKIYPARGSDFPTVQAEGRGLPLINFADGRTVETNYGGDDKLAQALSDGSARPLALATADFDEDGVPDTGPNNLQNFPVLTSVAGSGGNMVIQGSLDSAGGLTYSIDFYANDTCDSSGHGEGKAYIGSTTVTTDASCTASFTVSFPVPTINRVITATATDPQGNTSEFSNCLALITPETIGVYRPSDTFFHLRNTNTPGFADISVQYGAPDDLPIVGDWDGNGSTTIGLFRPSSNHFFLRNSNTPGFPDVLVQYGAPGDMPIVGDWD